MDRCADPAVEAHFLHRCFFGGDAPAEVVDRYVRANALCCSATDRVVNTMVTRRLDPEAIELGLRRRGGGSALRKKIAILFYLAEVRAEYYRFFVGKEERWGRAVAGLVYAVLRTGVKYVKGLFLIRMHGLV